MITSFKTTSNSVLSPHFALQTWIIAVASVGHNLMHVQNIYMCAIYICTRGNRRFQWGDGKKSVSFYWFVCRVRGSSTLALPQPVFVTVYPVSATIIGCAELFSFHAATSIPPSTFAGQRVFFFIRKKTGWPYLISYPRVIVPIYIVFNPVLINTIM